MFTTDLSHRVFLTVLLLFAAPLRIGNCQEATENTEIADYTRSNRGALDFNGVQDQMYDEARSYQSSSPSEDLVLALDQPVQEEELMQSGETKSRSSRMDWRKGDSSQSTPSSSSGMQTVISSTSYSVKPGNSASTVILNTKPIGIITAGSSSDSRKSSPFYSQGSSYPQYSSSSSGSYNNQKGEQSTYYQNYDRRNNNCFGKKCLMTATEEGLHPDLDEWKTYHSKLNSDIKKNKNYQEHPSGSSNYGDGFSSGGRYQSRYSTMPFTIEPSVPGKRSHYEDSFPLSSSSSRPGHRVSRTTTSTTTKSPGWVQLQPLFSSTVYDPFAHLNNNNISSVKSDEFINPQTQISKRIGVELSPESFAERHGWGHHVTDHGGSRPPSWLEQLNQHQHSQDTIRRPGPTRDEDIKNWVKLEPIRRTNVSISKWVPKGTPPTDLPTTNWGIRDKPNSYWDTRLQNQHNSYHKDSINILRPPSSSSGDHDHDHGWPSKGSSSSYTTRYPDFLNNRYASVTKKPTNSWGDVIYPEGPTSATASWEASKAGLANYPSSFPVAHSPPYNSWPSDIRRHPTGSWSAPSSQSYDKGDSNRRFAIHRNPTNLNGHFDRNYNPPSYPDLEAHNNDPRWVLVSNSHRVTVSPHHTASHSQSHNLYNRNPPPYLHDTGKLYNHELDRYPSDLYNSGHRLGKDLFKRASTTPTAATMQDDAFNRINATLQSLIPVLNSRGSGTSTRRPPVLKTITPNSLRGEELNYLDNTGSGRAANATTPTNKRNRKGLGLNPVFAAVGAGMIPATMAAVLPMYLGRKKRGVQNSYAVVNLNDADLATLKFLSSISNKSSSKEVVFSKLANVPDRGAFDTRGDVYSTYKTSSHKKPSNQQHVLR